MADMNSKEIVRLANDVRRNKVAGNYSMDEANDVLYNALVDANNGKKYLDPRDIRDGKCGDFFAIIEEVITATKHDILTEDPFFMQFVEYRNGALGDKPEFIVPSNELFWVSEIGSGSQAIRRQRLLGDQTYTINPTWKAIKIYEEMERMLSGRVDFAAMIDLVGKSFAYDTMKRIYDVLTGTIVGLEAPYSATGSFVEATAMNMIQHVKAANGTREAFILGTLVGLNKWVAASESSNWKALESKYLNGFAGLFNGTPKVELMNAHVPGTDTFVLNDNDTFVIAGGTKPVIYYTEGNSLILPRSFMDNMDLTEEYGLFEKTGIVARQPAGEGKFGRYTITA